jgi:hypothetical protein
VTQEEGAGIPREQGWRGPLLAFLALLFLPASPPLGLLLPVDQTLVILAPALAAAAVMGWRVGGRWTLAVVWTAFAFWVVWLPAAGPFALLARGWGVLLAACFGGALAWRGEARFLPRALVAILAALVLGALVSVGSGGLDIAAGLIADDVARRAELALAALREFTGRAEWAELARDNPAADQLARQVEEQFTLVPRVARQLVPAMLALESLAVLALAWAVYHRFGRVRLGPPLAPLRDLRFHDAFVWGLIAGLLVLVVPVPSVVRTFGVNLLVFFGVLFALRGLGVLLWFLAPGRWMLVVWTIVLVMFWSVIAAVALAIGVGDTWLDWRRRPRPKSQRSE